MSEDPILAQNQSASNSDPVNNNTAESKAVNDTLLSNAGSNENSSHDLANAIPQTELPEILAREQGSIPISFTNGNFRINLEYQDQFFKQCLISERITSYVSLGLITCGVIFTLGAVLYAEIKGLPVDTYSVFSGVFTSVLGGCVYALNVGARTRIHDTAKELSNLGKFVIAKDFVDQIANQEKKDNQLAILIQELVRPTQRNS